MKKYLLLIILAFSLSASSQEALNAYKYVVVPSKFEFQKEADQYGINTLLKYKFQQLGFETYLDNEEVPKELTEEGCMSIRPTVLSTGGVFVTKFIVEIKDCLNQVLFTTQEGVSRSKSYRISYNEALRQSLKSFDGYKLSYKPKVESTLKSNDVLTTNEKSQTVNTKRVFIYNTEHVTFEKTNTIFYAEIKSVNSDKIYGTLSKTSKIGLYHIRLNSKTGLGYYDETGNFIIEFLENSGQVSLQKLQLLN